MFIGHFGIGLAAKKAAPKTSLAVLFTAAQWLDLLWPTLLLFNLEKVAIRPGNDNPQPLDFIYYPISHSLLMVLFWAFLMGLIYWLFHKNKKAAVVIGLCVVSHWVLDLFVHFPDLPIYPGNSPLFGFGLWAHQSISLILETVLFLLGTVIYIKTTKPKNTKGSIGLWVLILLLLVIHIANIFGPPPTSVQAIAWAAQLQWLFVALAYWVDKNRMPIAAT